MAPPVFTSSFVRRGLATYSRWLHAGSPRDLAILSAKGRSATFTSAMATTLGCNRPPESTSYLITDCRPLRCVTVFCMSGWFDCNYVLQLFFQFLVLLLELIFVLLLRCAVTFPCPRGSASSRTLCVCVPYASTWMSTFVFLLAPITAVLSVSIGGVMSGQ